MKYGDENSDVIVGVIVDVIVDVMREVD